MLLNVIKLTNYAAFLKSNDIKNGKDPEKDHLIYYRNTFDDIVSDGIPVHQM